jgi:hypothetical protein
MPESVVDTGRTLVMARHILVEEVHPEVEVALLVVEELHPEVELTFPVVEEVHPEVEVALLVVEELHPEVELTFPVVEEVHPEVELALPAVEETPLMAEALLQAVDTPLTEQTHREAKTPASAPQAQPPPILAPSVDPNFPPAATWNPTPSIFARTDPVPYSSSSTSVSLALNVEQAVPTALTLSVAGRPVTALARTNSVGTNFPTTAPESPRIQPTNVPSTMEVNQ